MSEVCSCMRCKADRYDSISKLNHHRAKRIAELETAISFWRMARYPQIRPEIHDIEGRCQVQSALDLAETTLYNSVTSETDLFNRKQVEAVCRAVCKVEGLDPDGDTYGDGCDPAWTRYADAVADALATSSLTSNNSGGE